MRPGNASGSPRKSWRTPLPTRASRLSSLVCCNDVRRLDIDGSINEMFSEGFRLDKQNPKPCLVMVIYDCPRSNVFILCPLKNEPN